MKRCACLLGLLAGLLAAAPGLAGPRDELPGILGSDDRVVLDPTVWPWTAFGRVNRDGAGFCTGAMVAPDLVLTAGHCIYHPRSGKPLAPHRLHFLAGYRRGAFLAHAVAKEIRRPDGYDPVAPSSAGKFASDWALLVLEHPLDIRPLAVRPLSDAEAAARGPPAACRLRPGPASPAVPARRLRGDRPGRRGTSSDAQLRRGARRIGRPSTGQDAQRRRRCRPTHRRPERRRRATRPGRAPRRPSCPPSPKPASMAEPGDLVFFSTRPRLEPAEAARLLPPPSHTGNGGTERWVRASTR